MVLSKKRLFAVAAVFYVLLGVVAIFFASERISRYQYHTLGAEAQNIALLAAQFLQLSDADVAQLKGMDFTELRNSEVNKRFAARFGPKMHNSLKYVYVISHLPFEEVKYRVRKDETAFYKLAENTPLDGVWLLDVIVNRDEQMKANHTADYYNDRHRYTALHDDILAIYEARRTGYMKWTDEWGAHVSGFTPLYSEQGAYIGLVGADLFQSEFHVHNWHIVGIMVLLFVLPSILLTAVYYTAYRKYDRLMWRYGNIDELTGVYTRRFFMERIRRLLENTRKRPRDLSLIVADIDDFKVFNDTYGHQTGDDALRQVAQALAGNVRNDDFVARMGGEEFIVVLPETDAPTLHAACERLKQAVEALRIPHVRSTTGEVLTISQGACHVAAGTCPSLEEIIERADKALYVVKKSGKNAWYAADAAPTNGCPPPDGSQGEKNKATTDEAATPAQFGISQKTT